MLTIAQLTEFLGWVSVINIVYLFVATIILTLMRETITSLHSKILKIDKNDLNKKYLDFLSMYKVMTLVFFVAPYIALKIME